MFTLRGNHEQALSDYTAMHQLATGLAAGTNILTEGLGSTGIAQIVLGDFQAAIAIADTLDTVGYISFSGDEIRAAALIGLGGLEAARSIIDAHAADAVAGRLSRKANNSLLLLALLAEANDDLVTAQRLLMHVESARTPLLMLSLDFAHRLGTSAAFETARGEATDRHLSGLRAIEVLREELA